MMTPPSAPAKSIKKIFLYEFIFKCVKEKKNSHNPKNISLHASQSKRLYNNRTISITHSRKEYIKSPDPICMSHKRKKKTSAKFDLWLYSLSSL